MLTIQVLVVVKIHFAGIDISILNGRNRKLILVLLCLCQAGTCNITDMTLPPSKWHIAASEGCNNRPCNLHVTLHCVTSGRFSDKAIKLIQAVHDICQNLRIILIPFLGHDKKLNSFLLHFCYLYFLLQTFKGVHCKFLMANVSLIQCFFA